MSNPAAVIEAREATKVYRTREGTDLLALDRVSLTVGDGEFVAVVGPSGCGKTTLLRLVAGLTRPSQGTVFVRGDEVRRPRRDIGIVFQEPLLLPWLRVASNVLIPVEVQGRSRSDYRERAHALLDMVGLHGFDKRYPNELSGGMQQRVAIARALVHDPSLLLMDEPLGALDAMTREQMGLELQRIWQATGKTAFLITHSIAEAVFLADRVVVMTPRPGRIAAIVDVPLPRPRQLSVLSADEFAHLTGRVRAALELPDDQDALRTDASVSLPLIGAAS